MLQLLDSVGEGGGGDRLALPYLGAGDGAVFGADLLQDLMASRIGQGLRDQVNLMLGKSFLFRHCYLPFIRNLKCSLLPSLSVWLSPRHTAEEIILGSGTHRTDARALINSCMHSKALLKEFSKSSEE
jgi:hypothetical protein